MSAALTSLELQALVALNAESESNDHDFGVLEYVDWPNRKQLGGILTSLQQKGVVTSVDITKVDGASITQYVIAPAYRNEEAQP